MPYEAYKIYQPYEPDKYKTSTEVKVAKALARAKKEGLVSKQKSLTAEYVYQDENGRETRETIELDIEKNLESYIAFYQKHNIDLHPDFEEKVRDIWERNLEEIQESAQKQGFDELLLIPENLFLPDLHAKMTEGYEKTYEGGNFKSGGSFVGVKETENKTRIVLLHKNRAQNLEDRPELKATLGGTGQKFIDQGEKLQLTDYLIYQRKYFEETQKHLDEIGWTWLPGSESGGRFVNAFWDPAHRRLFVDACGASNSYGHLGCRLSRCFTKSSS